MIKNIIRVEKKNGEKYRKSRKQLQNNRLDPLSAGFASPISNQDGYITALTWTGP